MKIEIPFWHNVDVSELTLELIESDSQGNIFLKLNINGINLENKKINWADKIKMQALDNIWDLTEVIVEAYYEGKKTEDYDEFKMKSQELMGKVKIL